jgi:pantoate--beta-alanine ligase
VERLETTAAIREYVRGQRVRGKSIAFVPTMGALHDGHRSCVDVARRMGDVVVVSIFVNPTQFGPREDFSKYPRPLQKDLDACLGWGVDAVFVPDTHEVYPVEQDAWVEVGRFSEPLCGRTRVGHFRGVATVVLKLFNIVQPDTAVFGQKDAQQAVVIREMTRQLDLPVSIALSPTVREPDGLALSSRNAYLSADERARAPWIYRSLCRGKDILESGERNPGKIVDGVRRHLESHGIPDIEYVELVNARDLSIPARAEGRVLLAVAARVGATRLIDNLCFDVREGGGVDEAMLFD